MSHHRSGQDRPRRRAQAIVSVAAIGVAGFASLHEAGATVYGVSQVTTAYGFTNLYAKGIDGSGQTIAVVEDYDDTYIASDVNKFSTRYNLPQMTVGGNLTIVGDTGGAVPTTTTSGPETALDVEWIHAIAPKANILLVETDGNIATAAKYAASVPGVSAVSISYGSGEFSTEKSYDSYYAQPANHAGVAFVASSGDSSSVSYVSASPNVISAGGTELTINASTKAYISETAWSNSGGGTSLYEAEPSYQKIVGTSTGRMTPDVSYNSSGNTPVQTYIAGVLSYSWGTSAAAPQWAALLALADEQRSLNGLTSLSSSQALSMMYALYNTPYYTDAFHDITDGTNGNGISAGTGYDQVTGLGSPKADWLVEYLGGTIAIPEPGVMSIVGVGMIAMGRRRRRV